MGKYNTVGFVRHRRNTGTVCKIPTCGVPVTNPSHYEYCIACRNTRIIVASVK